MLAWQKHVICYLGSGGRYVYYIHCNILVYLECESFFFFLTFHISQNNRLILLNVCLSRGRCNFSVQGGTDLERSQDLQKNRKYSVNMLSRVAFCAITVRFLSCFFFLQHLAVLAEWRWQFLTFTHVSQLQLLVSAPTGVSKHGVADSDCAAVFPVTAAETLQHE